MKKTIKSFIAFAILSCSVFAGFSQTVTQNTIMDSDLQEKSQLANASKDYPVTAGDVYQLSFAAGSSPISYTIPVDSSYTIKVANLATLNGAGKTFMQLKAQVEAIVNRNYPMGGVQFYIIKPSVFSVVVKGEVNSTQIRQVWALTRLSTLLNDSLTPFASNRFITVISKDGKKNVYDLFKASRDGDLSQNPYLRPEDTIIISRYERHVTITGAVERPGVYELSKGENLKDLIERYGGGLTPKADLSRISLTRTTDSENPSGNMVYLEKSACDSNFELKDNDTIHISGFNELMPAVILEGIIQNPEIRDSEEAAVQENTSAISSYRKIIRFYEGENYAPFIRRIADNFTNFSDLDNSYIIRQGQKLNLNITEILSDFNYKSDYNVQKDDKIMIPYSQGITNKILVNGEVKNVSEVQAWPLRRLSEIINPYLTQYSSTRNVTVRDPEGNVQNYDLFKASRYGDMNQNPYIQAGCTITVNRYSRKASISGGVERPGTYELLDNENFTALYTIYGGGLIQRVDKTRTELFRTFDADGSSGRKVYLKESVFSSDYRILDKDSFYIYTYDDLVQVAFIEGAVKLEKDGDTLESSNKISIPFSDGENYAYFVRRNRASFSDSSDLKSAYIMREGKAIPLNLETILYDKNYTSDLTVLPYDILMIPFEQKFVSVAGAVQNPGRYPYIPDRTWDYYIGLAGGFDRSRNANNIIKITDKHNKKYSKKEYITPESTITAETTAFMFYFSKYAPLVTTTLSAVTTVISIIAITSK